MSVRIMSMVFENQSLSSTEKLIMLALADHSNDEGKSIYPSQNTISTKTGFVRTTVNEQIKILIDKGYLVKTGYKKERSNVLELEIVVSKLRMSPETTGGVVVADRGVSSSPTGGVVVADTNHHLTIIKPLKETSQNFSTKEEEVKTKTLDEIGNEAEEIVTAMYLQQIERNNSTHLKNTEGYPEKVRPIIAQFCKRWNMVAPKAGSRGYSDWKKSGDDIADLIAGTKFKAEDVIDAVYDYIKTPDGMKRPIEGYSKFEVSRLGSIYNAVNAVIGKMSNDTGGGKIFYDANGKAIKW